MESITNNMKPSLTASIFAFMSVVLTISIGGFILSTISVHTCLILSTIIVCLIAKFMVGYTFDELMSFMAKSMEKATFGLWFFVAIAGLVGAWMISGTVPAVIYYGLGILKPVVFVPSGLILCSVMALCTGSSWATIGTIGVALIGIGESMGMPLPVTAAMIVSGASFGDKMSPVSDIPNLAALGAGADLYKSIKAMFVTMVPAYLIALVLFTLIGFRYGGGEVDMTIAIETRNILAENFNLQPMVLTSIILMLFLNFKKFPALPAMAIVILYSLVIAVVFQGVRPDIALEVINSGFSIETGTPFIDEILNRGGFQSMMWTFSIGFLSMSLGGMLERIGFLDVLIEKIAKKAKTVGQMALLVMGSSIACTAAFGDTYMPIVMNGAIYKKEFGKRGLDRAMLARLTSEGVMMSAPLMVWNAFGSFATTAMGIAPSEYIQFAFLNILSPLVSILMTFLGIGVVWNHPKNKGVRNFLDADLSDEPNLDDK